MSPTLRAVLSLLSIIALCTVAGCRRPTPGSGQHPTTTDAPACPVDADDEFCAAYADALCTAQEACCDDPTLVDASQDDCVERTRCECAAYRQGAAFTSGALAFDRPAESALVARLRARAETCDTLSFEQIDYASAARGTLTDGDDCTPVDDDYSRLFACAAGLACRIVESDVDVSGVCTPYVGLGAACGDEDLCEPGMHCAPSATPGEPGSCARDAAEGEPCADDGDCASGLCDMDASTCASPDPNDTWCGGDGPGEDWVDPGDAF